jgi:hypothetical protein
MESNGVFWVMVVWGQEASRFCADRDDVNGRRGAEEMEIVIRNMQPGKWKMTFATQSNHAFDWGLSFSLSLLASEFEFTIAF